MRTLYRPVWEGMQNSLRDILVAGFPADKVIQRQMKANRRWGSHDRKLFAEGVYDLVRWWRRLLYVCDVAWPTEDKWTADDTKVFQRAIEAWCLIRGVELDRSLDRTGLTRERVETKWNDPKMARAVRESLPDWLDAWGEEQLGARWAQVLPVLNQTAPVYLRTNTLRTNRAQLQQALKREEIGFDVVGEQALRLHDRTNVFLLDAFKQGWFEMQDFSSQQVAPALDAQAGQRVVDACAGAGGKTLHLAALMGNKGKILALDVTQKKLEKLRERATRASASLIETRLIESTKTVKRLADTADRLLLDVPCTGMGVWRRNPDSKWRLTREEIAELDSTQARILGSYPAMCKAGARMVYATCSIMPSENERQVEKFLSQNEKWTLERQETFWPEANGPDGFFLAVLVRK